MRLEFYGANKTTFQECRYCDGSVVVVIVIKTTEKLLFHIAERCSGMSSIPTLTAPPPLSGH
jgi:hypothetical protein